MSRAASSAPLPSRSSASPTGAASETNQRPGMPASWMPTSTPLREISDTTLEPGHLHRERRALGRRHRQVQEEVVVAGHEARRLLAADDGERAARSRSSRFPVAWERMCSSSPMFRPCAASPNTSIGPRCLEHRARRGPRSSRKKRSRATDSSSPTPNHSVRPRPRSGSRRAPSPVLDHPDGHRRRADAGHRTDVRVLVAGGQRDLAALEQRRGLLARRRPALEHAAASNARRCGSHTRSQVIGGPECSSVPSPSPGTRCPPARRHRERRAPSIRRTASRVGGRHGTPVPPPQPRQHVEHRGVAAGGGPPVHLDDRRALIAQRVGERSSPRFTASTRVSTSALGVMPPPAGSMAAMQNWTRSSRWSGTRRACSASAISSSSSASTPASTATTARSSRTRTASSSPAARRSRRRSCSRIRSAPARAAVVTNVSDVRAMGPPARHRRHARLARQGLRQQVLDGHVGRRTCSACRSSAAT